MNCYETLKLRQAKRIISNKDYSIGRADTMNDKVQHYKMMLKDAKTIQGKKFCMEMIAMYLKRYMYYVNKDTDRQAEA